MSKKKLKGVIKRISGKNTVAVEVVRVFHHPRYRKRILTSKVYLVHVAGGDAPVGRSVTIEETRPISKTKRWVIVELDGKPVGESKEISEVKKVKEAGTEKKVLRKRERRAKK
ncbi:MAG TPA: 30S ribosomal protein S17 [Patescibacteria group bacterium]|nr:30S ribosomal protein S17 [Patescibacteria group bacterium]